MVDYDRGGKLLTQTDSNTFVNQMSLLFAGRKADIFYSGIRPDSLGPAAGGVSVLFGPLGTSSAAFMCHIGPGTGSVPVGPSDGCVLQVNASFHRAQIIQNSFLDSILLT